MYRIIDLAPILDEIIAHSSVVDEVESSVAYTKNSFSVANCGSTTSNIKRRRCRSRKGNTSNTSSFFQSTEGQIPIQEEMRLR
jgi:hypothetical protein